MIYIILGEYFYFWYFKLIFYANTFVLSHTVSNIVNAVFLQCGMTTKSYDLLK